MTAEELEAGLDPRRYRITFATGQNILNTATFNVVENGRLVTQVVANPAAVLERNMVWIPQPAWRDEPKPNPANLKSQYR